MAKKFKLEETVGQWYGNVPHLPSDARQWLSDNLWWLALIGAVVSAAGLLAVMPLLNATVSIYDSSYYTSISGVSRFSVFITLVGYIATVVLLALAVRPLKAKSLLGWRLLFWSFVVNTVLNVLAALLVYNLFTAFMSVVSAAVAGYLLFEVQGHFGIHRKAKIVKKKK